MRQKNLRFLWNMLINMVEISKRTYKRNGLEIIVNSDGILWLNEKHVEEELDYGNLRVTTVNYLLEHKK